MIKNTFLHITGIGAGTERALWDQDIHDWNSLLGPGGKSMTAPRLSELRETTEESIKRLAGRDHNWFSSRLPSSETWRLFGEFRDSVAYLDIETTGLGHGDDHITTIALYDGKDIKTYVHGQNMENFPEDIEGYDLLVTFNGKCFDAPFIEREFNIELTHAHIDLRFLLKGLGYGGGLKKIEKRFGMGRDSLEGIDGYFAVLLWQDFLKNSNPDALDTLLAYNVEDTVNLERLMYLAYNMKLEETPFASIHALTVPDRPAVDYSPHDETVRRIMKRYYR